MFRSMKSRQGQFLGVTLAVVVTCLAGCGQTDSPISGNSPTAPALETQAGFQFTQVGEGGDGNGDPSAGALPVGGETPSASSGLSVALTGEVLEVSQLVPRMGGTLTVGRFSFRILPNSLSQPTMVTLRDLSGVSGRVECEVLPADLAISKNAHVTSFFSDLMPAGGCAIFEVQNSGTPSEAWTSLGGTLSGGGLKANVNHAGHFAPGTSQ